MRVLVNTKFTSIFIVGPFFLNPSKLNFSVIVYVDDINFLNLKNTSKSSSAI